MQQQSTQIDGEQIDPWINNTNTNAVKVVIAGGSIDIYPGPSQI